MTDLVLAFLALIAVAVTGVGYFTQADHRPAEIALSGERAP
jgi:hypothetical protein